MTKMGIDISFPGRKCELRKGSELLTIGLKTGGGLFKIIGQQHSRCRTSKSSIQLATHLNFIKIHGGFQSVSTSPAASNWAVFLFNELSFFFMVVLTTDHVLAALAIEHPIFQSFLILNTFAF
ncbi:hypothetical protein O6H91_Y008400 [Diphasiastrum complanatum]|nr:hypothetical protein O6H91_Y008400 [Diphasiastrum complanatum]